MGRPGVRVAVFVGWPAIDVLLPPISVAARSHDTLFSARVVRPDVIRRHLQIDRKLIEVFLRPEALQAIEPAIAINAPRPLADQLRDGAQCAWNKRGHV